MHDTPRWWNVVINGLTKNRSYVIGTYSPWVALVNAEELFRKEFSAHVLAPLEISVYPVAPGGVIGDRLDITEFQVFHELSVEAEDAAAKEAEYKRLEADKEQAAKSSLR